MPLKSTSFAFIEDFLIDAVIFSTVIANGVLVIGALFLVSSFKLRFKYSLLKFLILAGIPMLLFNLFVQLLTSVDRLMLSNLVIRESLVHYHFGYLLSMGIFAAFNSIAFLFIPDLNPDKYRLSVIKPFFFINLF